MTKVGGDTICGGSIISAWRILTAAHCLTDTLSTLVIAGAHNRRANEASQQKATVPARNYLIHESYNRPNNYDNDIAMLKLESPFKINEFVSVISLPNPALGDFAGMIARVSGWGRDESGDTQERLRYVDMPVITNQACNVFWPRVNSVNICTDTLGGRASCQGKILHTI